MTDVKTAKDAIEALRTVVAGREDFVYPGSANQRCYNFQLPELSNDGYPVQGWHPEHVDVMVPSCVVGHVLNLWGLDRKYWIRVEGGMEGTSEALEDIAYEGDDSQFVLSVGARGVLLKAQEAQDDGTPWGDALGDAERFYECLPQSESGE